MGIRIITVRIGLGCAPILNEKVPEPQLRGALYSWNPQERRFTLNNCGLEQKRTLDPRAVGVLVKVFGSVVNVNELIPPLNAVARAAWDAGFYSSLRVTSIEEAAALVGAARQKSSGDPVVVRSDHFVFVFKSQRIGGNLQRIPFRWAASNRADPMQISQQLRSAVS